MKKFISVLLVFIILFSFSTLTLAEDQKTKAEIVEEFKNSVQIGSYNTPKIDSEEDVKNMADNGISFVILFGWCVRGDMLQAVKWCEKYNIKCIVDGIWPELSDNEIRTRLNSEIAKSPAVIGHYIVDEPNASKFTRLAEVVKIYKEECPDMIPYINLLPEYATSDQLGTGTYKEYIDSFVKTVGTSYVCTDVYPLLTTTTRNDYFTSMATVQQLCLKNNKDIWMFIQGVAHAGYRKTSYEDFLSQNYIALAFGVTKIMNFCYSTPVDWGVTSSDEYYNGSVTADGDKTALYNDTSSVNKEITLICPILNKYKNVGTFTIKPEKGRAPLHVVEYNEEFESFTGFNDMFKTLSSLHSSVVGCFESKDSTGKSALIVANSTEILYNQKSNLTFSFKDPKVVIAYPDGIKTALTPDENGVYTIDLGIGDGVLIEIDSADIKLGDINSDGNISLVDAMLSFMSVAGKTNLGYYEKYAADTDKDGGVSLSDSMNLFLIVAGKTDL